MNSQIWEVVLAHHNDERHYYPEGFRQEDVVAEAKAEWYEEFDSTPRVISVKLMGK